MKVSIDFNVKNRQKYYERNKNKIFKKTEITNAQKEQVLESSKREKARFRKIKSRETQNAMLIALDRQKEGSSGMQHKIVEEKREQSRIGKSELNQTGK